MWRPSEAAFAWHFSLGRAIGCKKPPPAGCRDSLFPAAGKIKPGARPLCSVVNILAANMFWFYRQSIKKGRKQPSGG
jgi:hypothetical protein